MGFDGWSIRDKIVMLWALVIASIAILFVCVSLGNLLSENSANIASWVQAIGSISAIFAGIWAVRYQLIEQRKELQQRHREADRARVSRDLQIILGRISHSHLILRRINERLNMQNTRWKSLADSAQHLRDVLDAIPASEFPNPATALMVNSLRVPLATVSQALRECSEVNFGAGEKLSETSIKNIKLQCESLYIATQQSKKWLGAEIRKVASEAEREEMKNAVIFLRSAHPPAKD